MLALPVLLLGSITALPAATAAGTSCATGTPILGDYNGDASAEALVGQWVEGVDQWGNGVERFFAVSADGSATAFVDGWSYARNADLNGDTCSDVVLTDFDNHVGLVLGTPDGLDPDAVIPVEIPQTNGVDTSAADTSPAVGLRHDGISQVVVAGKVYDDFEYKEAGDNFVDVYTLDADGTPGVPQIITGEQVGASRTNSRFVTLAGSGGSVAVGSSSDRVGRATGAGAVYLFSPASTDAEKMVFRTRITQASKGVPGTAEAGDGFGESLSFRDGYLAIGAPGENIGGARDAGLVQPVRWNESSHSWTAYRAVHQGTAGVTGTNETGDGFGSTVLVTRGLTGAGSWDIAIGTPAEKVGSARGAGSVTVANFTRKVFRTYTQGRGGVPGGPEVADFFGNALGSLRTTSGADTLLIAADGEGLAGCTDAGMVVRSDGDPLTSVTTWASIAPPHCGADEHFWGLTISS